ncbi:MAG: hypothetical protein J7576_01375 [Siphonobacter aquaeclarae]|nr:hypothetical protein [Siphonobacter aquaeclarae]
MKHLSLLLIGLLMVGSSCRKNDGDSPAYLRKAMSHCDCSEKQLQWLKTIISEKKYYTPGATVPAMITSVSLGKHKTENVILLDSPLNSCSICPWAVLNCKGATFPFEEKKNATRGDVIWEGW